MMLRVISRLHALHDLRHRPLEYPKERLRVQADPEGPGHQRCEHAISRQERSVSFWFFSDTSPSIVRWNSHSRYAAPSAIPTAPQNAQLKDIKYAPCRIAISP